MVELDTIKKVVNKICSADEIREHICFFGGAIPYIYYGEESGREHSDIDILVDKNYINVIRELLKQSGRYQEELDSLQLGLGEDYGLKAWIDGVFVEFEPMFIDNGMLVRKSFSPNKEMAGTEMIPFKELTDLIVAIDIDGIKSYCQSPELIKAEKEKYKREKDLLDISFIDSQEIDIEKYHRVKKLLELSEVSITSYEDLRNKKTL